MLRFGRSSRWHHAPVVLLLALAMLCALPVPPVRADVTDQQVLDTINKQINFLLSKKNANNNWEDHQFGGKWPLTGAAPQVLYALHDCRPRH